MLAADLLVVVATDLGYRASSCPEGASTVEAQVRKLLAGFDDLGDRLVSARSSGSRPPLPSAESLRRAAIDCLRRSGGDEEATRGAMAVVIAGEWVQNLVRLEENLEQPVEAAVAAARVHWWR